jgi:hypothetical protein
MSDHLQSAAPPPEPTDVRFSLKSLLILTVPLAIVCAVGGLIVRRLSSEVQTQVLSCGAAWLVVVVVWLGYYARTRYKIDRIAGVTLMILPPISWTGDATSESRRIIGSCFLMGMGVLVTIGVFPLLLRTGDVHEMWATVMITAVIGASITATGATQIWWRKSIHFRQHGIVQGIQFFRWDHILNLAWDALDPGLTIQAINQRGMDGSVKAAVSADDRDRVQNILDEMASRLPLVPLEPVPHYLRSTSSNRLPAPQLIAKPPDRLLVWICSCIALFMWILFLGLGMPRKGPPDTILWGIAFGGLLICGARWMISADGGRPLIRVFGRPGIRQLIPVLAIAAGMGLVSYFYWWLPTWLVRAARAGSFGILYWTANRHSGTPLDLQEFGVTLQDDSYWPWSQTRVIEWDHQDTGKLILGRGWRQIVATVPRERRDAVDALLTEKIAQ